MTSAAGTKTFRQLHFAQCSDDDWSDWRWQFKHRIRSLENLADFFTLTEDEAHAFAGKMTVPLGITPYYASLIDPDNPQDPLRRSLVPVRAENFLSLGEQADPLGEEASSPVPGLVHRYPDRVLFLVSELCAVYCRYCTRSRLVGDHGANNDRSWEQAIEYIQQHPEIRDVLLSGGDPFTLPDDRLDQLLGRVSTIDHVEFVRIGTKVPAVLPQRITPRLLEVLKKHKPWLSLHFTHPNELTPEVAEACGKLADAGLPLGGQTVLLHGINDDAQILTRLFHGLLKIRVRPYYLYLCDPIPGSRHFRTSVDAALSIMQKIRGHTTGYAVPTLVIDAPGGGGKIPIYPESIIGRNGGNVLLRNFEGKTFSYPESGADNGHRADL